MRAGRFSGVFDGWRRAGVGDRAIVRARRAGRGLRPVGAPGRASDSCASRPRRAQARGEERQRDVPSDLSSGARLPPRRGTPKPVPIGVRVQEGAPAACAAVTRVGVTLLGAWL